MNKIRPKTAVHFRETVWLTFFIGFLFTGLQEVWASNNTASAGPASLKLASIFGDNMVFQQGQDVPVWGWSRPGEVVTVRFLNQTKSTKAGADGHWLVRLGRLEASWNPRKLMIRSGGTVIFTNVLIGEVWLCSGQSNMEKPIGKGSYATPCFDAEPELGRASFPAIRICKIGTKLAATPADNLEATTGWLPCSSNTLSATSFSAVGYFFGREVHTNLGVPVGLIEAAWGGTRIEPWIPTIGFEGVSSLKELVHPGIDTNGTLANWMPTAIYNGMIAPMAGFAIRGALWYQGEGNCGRDTNNAYTKKMEALVRGWRRAWAEGNFPFYFVQIAPFRYTKSKPPRSSPEVLPEFWSMQSHAAERIPNTGMVVTTDLVDDLDDIHPRDKRSVGHRLALLALNKTYGQKNTVCCGPTFKSMKVIGNVAVLRFDNVAGSLMSKDGLPLTWFTVAGTDGKYIHANAQIVGDVLRVSAPGVERPKVVRFAWNETAQPNLFNQAGWPAVPFSSDDP